MSERAISTKPSTTGHANRTVQEAIELVRGGMSIFNAALEKNVDSKTLTRACRESGITSRAPTARPNLEMRARVIALWKQGVTKTQIRARTGASASAITEFTRGIKPGQVPCATDLPDV